MLIKLHRVVLQFPQQKVTYSFFLFLFLLCQRLTPLLGFDTVVTLGERNVCAECVCSFGRLSCCCLARATVASSTGCFGLKCHNACRICSELDLKGRDLCCCRLTWTHLFFLSSFFFFQSFDKNELLITLICCIICLWTLLSLLGIHLLSFLAFTVAAAWKYIYCCLSH